MQNVVQTAGELCGFAIVLVYTPLARLFDRVADKEAFFSRKRIIGGFAAGAFGYAVAAGCGYQMVRELKQEWQYADMFSINAVRKGGKWGIAMIGATYAGDLPLAYSAFGLLYWRRRRKQEGAVADARTKALY